MKRTVTTARHPSNGFSIESIIGSPTSNNHDDNADNNNIVIINSNARVGNRISPTHGKSEHQRVVKPTPKLLSRSGAGFHPPEEALLRGRDDQVLPPHMPLATCLKLNPYALPQAQDKVVGGVEATPQNLLTLRSLWGLSGLPGSPHPSGLRPFESGLHPSHHLQALGLPHPVAGLPLPFHPSLVAGMGARDSLHHLYPWLLARQQHCFGLAFPGSPEASFFYHLHRKPKRIRTAFSPSQLVRLEHAFENNHYVVGQERKDLASNLGLTETQVKVWFQNRRTKYKRMKAEEDSGSSKAEQEHSEHSPRLDQSPGPSKAEPEEDVMPHTDKPYCDAQLADSENEDFMDVNRNPPEPEDFSL